MAPPDIDLATKALGDFWSDMGVEVDLPPPGAPRPAAPTLPAPLPAGLTDAPRRPEPRRLNVNPLAEAKRIAAASSTLLELKAAMESFDGCPLKKAARSTVVFDGALDAEVMIIGEAPGAEEDAKGLPFVGRSGQLLDRMLASIGLSRTTNVYITNIIYWRPPGNRDPAPDEILVCSPFLARQIELKRPKLMLTAGKPATQALLKTEDGIMRLRGRRATFRQEGLPPIPCMPILHPSYLLRRPPDKAKAWADMLAIAALCDELGVKRETGL